MTGIVILAIIWCVLAMLAELMKADYMIAVHCALAGIFTVLIIRVALLGQDFVNLFFGG